MAEAEGLTHAEALLWLNDRLGRPVRVAAMLGGGSILLLQAQGELRHWREANPLGLAADAGDEDVSGLYGVGDAAILDVTNLNGAVSEVGEGGHEALRFPLDERSGLTVFVIVYP
jgi:hypothetical protein